jgi:stage III sporulation protein AG
MVIKTVKTKIHAFLKKNKYAFFVVLIGMVLMLWPFDGFEADTASSNDTVETMHANGEDVEKRLERILSQINGAGNVSVLLMEAKGEEIIYQTNSYSTDETNKSDTVTVTDSNRNQNGLIKQVFPAQYAGVIVVCEGADDPQVRLLLTDAVSKVTGLGANKISVLKMK